MNTSAEQQKQLYIEMLNMVETWKLAVESGYYKVAEVCQDRIGYLNKSMRQIDCNTKTIKHESV